MNIFVGNLNSLATESQLESLFMPFGEVRSAKIIVNFYSGQTKGFAFIDMPDRESAERAIKGLNRTSLNAQIITVNETRVRDNSHLH